MFPNGSVTLLNQKTIDAIRNGSQFNVMTMDAAVAGGMTFLQAELEKLDPKVREPLTNVTYMRDIVIKSGGGWVDWTSVFNINYGISDPNELGIMGGQTNVIPTMQADIGKDLFPVYNWGNILKYGFIDMSKANQVGRSLEDLLDKGIRLNWNKTLDKICYQGRGDYGGIVNNGSIHSSTAALNAASSSTQWKDKSPEEILYDINSVLIATMVASEYDVTGIANHILLPPDQYGILTRPMALGGVGGYKSILEYVLDNNIAKRQGVEIKIELSRWCIGAGDGSPATDRLVAYRNDEDKLYMDVTVPIMRAMTMPDINQAAYLTLYLGQIGVPKFLYLQTAAYLDGI
jgi:hypothetical protein